jgi:hypothetical protein
MYRQHELESLIDRRHEHALQWARTEYLVKQARTNRQLPAARSRISFALSRALESFTSEGEGMFVWPPSRLRRRR